MAAIIIAGIDIANHDSCNAVLAEATALAKSKDAELHICYVLPYGFYSYIQPYIPQNVVDDTIRRAHADLDQIAASPVVAGVVVKTHLRQGGIYQQLLLLADELSPDTIVLNAAISHDGRSADLGPVTSHVARYARCKVLIVR